MVARTCSIQGITCIYPEQLGTARFLSKLLTRRFFDFKQIWTQHQKLESRHTPPPFHWIQEIWDFSRFGLSVKSWKLNLPPFPPPSVVIATILSPVQRSLVRICEKSSEDNQMQNSSCYDFLRDDNVIVYMRMV